MPDLSADDLLFANLVFNNAYAGLPGRFYVRQAPVEVPDPGWVAFNSSLAKSLWLNTEALTSQKGLSLFAGNWVPADAQPIAMAYAGHQFGAFVPSLGDGRAILLGQINTPDGQLDIHLKGAGRTPFSRGGDGRSALGSVIREYIVSEAMHALGIPTTRALAAVTSGEQVQRERPLPGGILTRLAQSHVRVGTFQYFASRNDHEAVSILTDYVIDQLYPECRQADDPVLSLFETVMERHAKLVAQWVLVGFVHGVMNTDNMAISGETIDYGPCAFLDEYHIEKVFSSIDWQGRYAYGRQWHAAQWNLARLAETLIDQIDDSRFNAKNRMMEIIESFEHRFQHHWRSGMRRKLGLNRAGREEADDELILDLLNAMQENALDYTLTFRALSSKLKPGDDQKLHANVLESWQEKDQWLDRWNARLQEEGRSFNKIATEMDRVNPLFIPRNHRIEEVIKKAVEGQDYSLMHEFLKVLSDPFTMRENDDYWSLPPKLDERVYQTFCGT